MIESVVKYVVSELGVLSQAPVAFILCLSVLSIIVWRALNWRYAGTIDSYKSRNELQAAQITDYKDKLSGATPDEAKKRLDALELQVKALSPRRLLEDEKKSLLRALKGFRANIEIAHDAAAGDAKAFTADLADTFNDAGWGLSLPMIMGVGMPPRTGVALKVHNTEALEPAELAVKSALDEVGIEYNIQPGLRRTPPQPAPPPGFPTYPTQPDPDVGLLITSKMT